MNHPLVNNVNHLVAGAQSSVERFCAKIVGWTGAPMTLCAVIIFQIVWIIVGQATHEDPFPFIFMLTVSNVIQLVLIVVLAVGSKQQTLRDEIRAEQDHENISRILFLLEDIQNKVK